jgi:hypothetical protein
LKKKFQKLRLKKQEIKSNIHQLKRSPLKRKLNKIKKFKNINVKNQNNKI